MHRVHPAESYRAKTLHPHQQRGVRPLLEGVSGAGQHQKTASSTVPEAASAETTDTDGAHLCVPQVLRAEEEEQSGGAALPALPQRLWRGPERLPASCPQGRYGR